uniref:Rab-GAP TBC domain-containing protein n=1 Tax=Trichuris muris TaxID=70415 RepID=A0A5S6QFI2_TRIMR
MEAIIFCITKLISAVHNYCKISKAEKVRYYSEIFRARPFNIHCSRQQRISSLCELMEEVEEELLNGKQKAGNADQKLGTIVELAQREGGFGSDQTRRKIWRLLSEQFAETHMYEEVLSRPTFQDIISHKEFDQVQADVRRTLLRFPPNTTDSDRHELLEALTPLIIKVLIAYPEARYYQGFHDICLTVLLVLGPTDALFVSYNLAKNFFSRFLEQPMEYASEHLERIYMIVANEDWYLYDHLVSNEVPIIFALSWIITWFSHDLKHYESITRLFDFFMASHKNGDYFTGFD